MAFIVRLRRELRPGSELPKCPDTGPRAESQANSRAHWQIALSDQTVDLIRPFSSQVSSAWNPRALDQFAAAHAAGLARFACNSAIVTDAVRCFQKHVTASA